MWNGSRLISSLGLGYSPHFAPSTRKHLVDLTLPLQGCMDIYEFAKGSCRFGDACKYLHNGVHGKSTLLPRTSGSASSVPGVTRSDLDMLQSLLAKFGLNAPNISTPSPPVAYTVSVPPGFQSVSAQLSAHPTYQGGSFPGLVHLGQSPSMPFHPSQLFASGSQGSGQATLLPNAFNTTTLQEPASGNWNMDTGASSHLNDSVHCLSDILNMCIYPSVAVGDGRYPIIVSFVFLDAFVIHI
ncbi:ribonuclease H-like domain-containing protein [Tanacetum coccineum]